MAGGGKGGSKGPSLEKQLQMQQQAMAMARPNPVQLQTSGWGGMGINAPQNPQQMGTAVTGIGTQAPSWAQGNWAMPWWGQQAPNVGAAMMQQQNPGAYGAQMGQGNVASNALGTQGMTMGPGVPGTQRPAIAGGKSNMLGRILVGNAGVNDARGFFARSPGMSSVITPRNQPIF